MLPVDHLSDAVLAERVATLGDVGVIECLEADDALSELADDLLDRNLNLLFELRALSLQLWYCLDHSMSFFGFFDTTQYYS